MTKILSILLLAAMLVTFSCGKPGQDETWKGESSDRSLQITTELGGDIAGDKFTPDVFMKAFFGNYHPLAAVSVLSPAQADDMSARWILQVDDLEELSDWKKLRNKTRTEFFGLVGKVPYKYLKSWRLGDGVCLIAFEAGGWSISSDSWGGAIFDSSHDLGMACYMKKEGGWECAGYTLYLGQFGPYCTTTFAEELVQIGDSEYIVQTLAYGSALIGLVDYKPVVMLEIPCYHSIGHGNPELFSSHLRTEKTGAGRYDIVVETKGEIDEIGTPLSHSRRYRWNDSAGKYKLVSNKGNIPSINQLELNADQHISWELWW